MGILAAKKRSHCLSHPHSIVATCSLQHTVPQLEQILKAWRQLQHPLVGLGDEPLTSFREDADYQMAEERNSLWAWHKHQLLCAGPQTIKREMIKHMLPFVCFKMERVGFPPIPEFLLSVCTICYCCINPVSCFSFPWFSVTFLWLLSPLLASSPL